MRQATISGVALVIGIALTAATGGADASVLGALVLGALVHAVVAIGCTLSIRQWLDQYTSRARQELDAASAQRQAFEQDLSTRQADLTRREAEATRITAVNEARVAEALKALQDERVAHALLRQEYDDLAGDFNEMVSGSLQQGANRFPARSTTLENGAAHLIPHPTRYRQHDVTHQRAHGMEDPALGI